MHATVYIYIYIYLYIYDYVWVEIGDDRERERTCTAGTYKLLPLHTRRHMKCRSRQHNRMRMNTHIIE